MKYGKCNSILRMAILASLATGCASMTATKPGTMDELLVSVDSEQYPALDNMSSSTASSFPKPMETYVSENRQDGLRSQVLNDMEASVVAMEIGAPEYAHRLLDDAYQRIETVYADNPAAKAARSNFVPEANKDFKGEPYERSMVGYYLGLSSAMMNDLEDARVSFKWGELQDTMSASETYQSDMALLNYLVGWVDQCSGRQHTADEFYSLAREYNTDLVAPDRGHNLLFLAETGLGPMKQSSGKYEEELGYSARDFSAANRIKFEQADRVVEGVLAEDLYFQASTLGGREIDKILAGKASFKEGAEDAASAAATVAVFSTAMAMNSSLAGNADQANSFAQLGGFAALISLGSKIAAEQSKPEADARYWDNLPAQIYVATAKLDPKANSSSISFHYGSQVTPTIVRVPVRSTGNCYLVWGSDRGIESWNPEQEGSWVSLDTSPKAGTSSATGGLDASFDTETHEARNTQVSVNDASGEASNGSSSTGVGGNTISSF
jgi:hypothetical protein